MTVPTPGSRRRPASASTPEISEIQLPELVEISGTVAKKKRQLRHQLEQSGGVVAAHHLSEHPGLDALGHAAGGATSFVDNGGAVLDRVDVQLIFWGSGWRPQANPNPSPNAISNAVALILSSSYMSGLVQYRSIQPGVLRGTTLVTGSNPPNPFSDTDVSNFLNGLIENGTLPEPDEDQQILYCVIMPSGVASTNASFVGEHTYFTYTDFDFPFDFDSDRAHFAWITNNGTLDGVTRIFSHELVESCTDPEGTAITGTPGTCSQGGWCEIGDVCNTTGRVNGVLVQSYWSERDGRCIVPTTPIGISGKVVLPDTAIGGPALAAMGDRLLFLGWTGTDSQHHLNVERSADGHTLTNKVVLGDTSIDGPALAASASRLFIGWSGTDAQHHLNVMSSTNQGQTFGNKVVLGDTSPYGPALAFGNGRLFLAWSGTDSQHHLNVMSSTDGISWGNKVTLGDTSSAGPALAFINGQLFLLWRGNDANHSLNVMQSANGTVWTNKVVLQDSSDVHPALGIDTAGALHLTWSGRDSQHRLNELISSGSINGFGSKLTFNDLSPAAPALLAFRGQLHLAWTGTDSSHHLNIAQLN